MKKSTKKKSTKTKKSSKPTKVPEGTDDLGKNYKLDDWLKDGKKCWEPSCPLFLQH